MHIYNSSFGGGGYGDCGWGYRQSRQTDKITDILKQKALMYLDGPNLDTELKNFEEILQKNRKKLFDEHFIDGKKRPEGSHHPLYVTVEQRAVAEDTNDAT